MEETDLRYEDIILMEDDDILRMNETNKSRYIEMTDYILILWREERKNFDAKWKELCEMFPGPPPEPTASSRRRVKPKSNNSEFMDHLLDVHRSWCQSCRPALDLKLRYQNMKNNPVMVNQETQTSALMPGMFQCSRCNSTQASKPMPRLAKIVPSLPSLDPDPEETTYLDHVTQQKISDLAATNPNIKVFAITKSGGKVLRKQEFSRKGNKLVHVSGSQTHRPTISGATVTSRDIPPSMMVSCTEVTNDDGFIEEATPTGQDTNEATLDFIYGADLSTTDIPGTSTEIPAIFPSVDHAETAGPSMTGFQVVEDQCVGGLAEEVKVEDEDKPPELGGLKLSLEVSDDPNAVVIKQEVLSDADPSDAVIDQQVEDEEEELMDEDDFDEEEEEEEEEEEIDYAAEEKADPTYSPRHEVRPPKGKKRKSDSDKQEEDWIPGDIGGLEQSEGITLIDDEGDDDERNSAGSKRYKRHSFPDTCPLCSTEWRSRTERTAHIQTHLPMDEGPEAIKAAIRSMKRTIKNHYISRIGWCDICNKFCPHLTVHLCNFHSKRSFDAHGICRDWEYTSCGKSWRKFTYPGICPLCSTEWKSETERITHTQTHLPLDKPVDVIQEAMDSLGKQIGPHYFKTMGICGICNQFRAQLRSHIYNCHIVDSDGKDKVLCPQCGKLCLNNAIFRQHFEYHHTVVHEDDYFQCPKCPSRFKLKQFLQNHIANVHSTRKHECLVCNKVFKLKPHLKRHEVIHSKVKPFKCDQCELSFTQKPNLKIHMRQHTGEKPYACDLCERAFTNKISLKTHQKKTHGVDWWKEQEAKKKKYSKPADENDGN